MIEEEEINKILKGPQWKGDGAPPPPTTLPVVTTLEIPVGRVLDAAKEQGLEWVLVIGWKDGKAFAAASSNDAGLMMLRMEQAKQNILRWVE